MIRRKSSWLRDRSCGLCEASNDVARTPEHRDKEWLQTIGEHEVFGCAIATPGSLISCSPAINPSRKSQAVHYQEQVIGIFFGVEMPRFEALTLKQRGYA